MAAKRNVQWVWSDGTLAPSLGEMTNIDSILFSVLSVYSGGIRVCGGDELSGTEGFSIRRGL